MKIANCNGDFDCHSWSELEDVILKNLSLNLYDDIWLNGEEDYPCLAILMNGNHACLHYFPDDGGNMWQSVGNDNEAVVFFSNGEKICMPADSVISLDKAMECARQFFETLNKPDCIEWREL